MRQPAVSSAATCSPRRAKSAARMDGRISTMNAILDYNCGDYNRGEEPVPGIAARQPEVGGCHGKPQYYVLILFPFERAGCVDQASTGLEAGERVFQNFALQGGEPGK